MASSPYTFHADYIAQALATEGGHLSIGRYGATLYFGDGCRLHTGTDEIKAECVAAGLPVIDSQPVPIGVLADLVMRGPEVRVGPKRSEPHWRFAYEPPYGAFSFVPLEYVIELYRAAGAEILNWPPPASQGLSEPKAALLREPAPSLADAPGFDAGLRFEPAYTPAFSTSGAITGSKPGAEEEELLGSILQLCARRGAPGRLGPDLLARFGSLSGVLAASSEALRTAGASEVTAANLDLLKRVTVGMAQRAVQERPVINSWNALLDYVRLRLRDERRERFHVLFLDARLRLIRDERLGSGTVNHAPVYPREVIRRALELSASALILVHNHPSGDPAPSRQDIEITRQVAEAGRLLGITVHDHLVVGGSEVASFKALGVF